MSSLRLLKPSPDHHRLSVEELLSLLGPEHFDRIEQQTRIVRETFQCPYTVRDYEHFKDTLFAFFAHYQKQFFNAEITDNAQLATWRQFGVDFAQQHLGSYKGDMRTAERNAIAGREGGMMSVINSLTDGILKLHSETYVRSVFFERIEPSDFDLRFRLADELLKKYGQFLFPGEELLPHYALGMHLEELIKGFVNHLHAIRREWRY